LLSRILGNVWTWSATAATITVSAWQFGWIQFPVKRVAVQAAAPPAARVAGVTASGIVMPRVASAPLPAPSATVALRVGQRFRDCDDDSCPWMVVLPAGSFMMGSPESEPQRARDEGPQHRVQVASFAIGQYEVTFRQWDACVAASGCTQKPGDQGWGRGQRPVIMVSWDDAQQYVKWLSGKTGQTYRLPSEAEWEYAARAGSTTPFAFGERITTAQANFDGDFTYNGSAKGESRGKTLPVGSLAKNAWELYDLQGNVWEWVQDCWHDSYQGAPADGRAWVSNCAEDRRLLRGGGWDFSPRGARSALRNHGGPTFRLNNSGFRLARMLP
jgi:formylglycine-generating enzyme required for sulfatase activity